MTPSKRKTTLTIREFIAIVLEGKRKPRHISKPVWEAMQAWLRMRQKEKVEFPDSEVSN